MWYESKLDMYLDISLLYFSLTMQIVSFPTDMAEMKRNYKLCTTAKLFLHEMFPEADHSVLTSRFWCDKFIYS